MHVSFSLITLSTPTREYIFLFLTPLYKPNNLIPFYSQNFNSQFFNGKITYVVGQTTFKVAVITYLVVKIAFVVV